MQLDCGNLILINVAYSYIVVISHFFIPEKHVIFLLSYLYQIVHLGEDDDEVTFSSATPIAEGDTFLFAARELKNLAKVDEMDSLAPILTMQVIVFA